MTYFKNRRLRLLIILSLAILSLFAVAGSAQAQGLVAGETVPEGTVIRNDAFLSGDNVVIDGLVDGDVLAVGRRVTVNGEVTGSLFAAAEVVNVNGKVGGSVYSAAATLEANESAAVDRSLYFVGAQINTDPASSVERDLAAAALGAQLAGSVGRDVRAVVGPLALFERILDLFNIETGFQILPSSALAPESQAPAVTMKPVAGQRWSVLSSPARYQVDSSNQAQTTGEWFLIRLRQIVQFLIVGGLVSWLFPISFNRWSDRLRRRPVASGLYGFVGFVTGFAGGASDLCSCAGGRYWTGHPHFARPGYRHLGPRLFNYGPALRHIPDVCPVHQQGHRLLYRRLIDPRTAAAPRR